MSESESRCNFRSFAIIQNQGQKTSKLRARAAARRQCLGNMRLKLRLRVWCLAVMALASAKREPASPSGAEVSSPKKARVADAPASTSAPEPVAATQGQAEQGTPLYVEQAEPGIVLALN